MTTFCEKYGPWALVTGASSGIGAEFARQIAAKGANVVLVARRRQLMEDLAGKIRQDWPVETRVVPLDLSRPDFMEVLRPAVAGLDIGLLVNNAAFGLPRPFLGNDLAEELDILQLNCRAPLVLTHEFARPMVARGRGGVIFVSSFLGYVTPPGWANYGATKAYDMHLAEALWAELRHQGVDVLALCPGKTYTGFAGAAGITNAGVSVMRTPPVVRTALRALGRRPSVIPGLVNRLMYITTRLMTRRMATATIGAGVRRLREQKWPFSTRYWRNKLRASESEVR